jgi:hypothetical protein
MIPSSACQPWPADHPGPRRKSSVTTTVSYTTARDMIENWAMLASLVATCKLNGVNPLNYIHQTLRTILDGHPKNQIELLMPWTEVARFV